MIMDACVRLLHRATVSRSRLRLQQHMSAERGLCAAHGDQQATVMTPQISSLQTAWHVQQGSLQSACRHIPSRLTPHCTRLLPPWWQPPASTWPLQAHMHHTAQAHLLESARACPCGQLGAPRAHPQLHRGTHHGRPVQAGTPRPYAPPGCHSPPHSGPAAPCHHLAPGRAALGPLRPGTAPAGS